MKLSLVAITAVLAHSASAHYIFSKLVVNGEVSDDWEYIRQTTRSEAYMPTKWANVIDNLTPSDNDFRCNLGSFESAGNTGVAEVAAGDTIAMKLFADADIAHPGPGQVYMSKAPSGNVKEYEGDGEWFKIWEKTLCNPDGDLVKDAWCTWGMQEYEFDIPADTPAGEYLVRAEHVGLHGAQNNEAEFFFSCAQIKVTGSGSGSPSTTYQIPGIYDESMTIFNGVSLYVDAVSDVQSDIDDSPLADAPWTGGGSALAASSTSAVATSSASVSSASVPATPSYVPSAGYRRGGCRVHGRRYI